jgi:phosphocarrier protein
MGFDFCEMKRISVPIVNRLGMHARPASLFAKTAERFKSDIKVIKDEMSIDGKSILGLMMLVAARGSELVIEADGPDEDDALSALSELVQNGFGED